MQGFAKKTIALLLCAAVFIGCFSVSAIAASKCPDISGSNSGRNEYVHYWSDVITSYLTPLSDGDLMRVQADVVENSYLIEYYNGNYALKSQKIIPAELPLFGGFYAMGNNYYILSGQSNPQESASVECYRITKYDLNWNRVSSVGLKDCNTFIPFDAGSARFAEWGKYLLIRTCHEMYLSDDGYHHQANVTIQLDTEAMRITDQLTDVAHVSAGYMSHSFNQFIQIENGHIVALDHGDAHLRALTLIKYPTDVTSGSFNTWNCDYLEAVPIPGSYGDNYTGIELGGFEISDENYIMAYSAVRLDNNFKSYKTSNVFVTTVNKTTNAVTTKQITDFAEGNGDTGCPFLIKINTNKYALIWSEGQDVAYAFIDGMGNLKSDIYYMYNASLSDCQPILYKNRLVWYTNNSEKTYFYGIDLNSPEKTAVSHNISGHDMAVTKYPENGNNKAYIKCSKCGATEILDVGYNLSVYWNTNNGEGYYYSVPQTNEFEVGDRLYFMFYTDGNEQANREFTVSLPESGDYGYVISDESSGYITFNEAGDYEIKISLKYNPQEAITINVTVLDDSINTNIDPGKLGDVNLNGKIDARDYLLLKRAFFGTYGFDSEQKTRGDINGNGKIDARDYLLLKRIFFGTYKI